MVSEQFNYIKVHGIHAIKICFFNPQGESSSLCWLTKGKQLFKGIALLTQLHVSALMAIVRLDKVSEETIT